MKLDSPNGSLPVIAVSAQGQFTSHFGRWELRRTILDPAMTTPLTLLAPTTLMASAMAMLSAALLLSSTTTIAYCYAFSVPIRVVLSQRHPRLLSIPVLTVAFASHNVNNRNDDHSDSINNDDENTSKEVVSMFERTFKVQPPWETFSTSIQPSLN